VPTAIQLPNAIPSDPGTRAHFLISAAILWILMTFKIPKISRLEAAGDPPTEGMPGYELLSD